MRHLLSRQAGSLSTKRLVRLSKSNPYTRFPGQLTFLDAFADMPDIWQTETGYELGKDGITADLHIIVQDHNRIAKIKEKQKK